MIKNTEEAIQLLEEYFPNHKEMKLAIQKGDDQILDIISEIADAEMDIWNTSLWDWAKQDHGLWLQEALENMYGSMPNFDIMKIIQYAQYLANESVLLGAINDIQRIEQ